MMLENFLFHDFSTCMIPFWQTKSKSKIKISLLLCKFFLELKLYNLQSKFIETIEFPYTIYIHTFVIQLCIQSTLLLNLRLSIVSYNFNSYKFDSYKCKYIKKYNMYNFKIHNFYGLKL